MKNRYAVFFLIPTLLLAGVFIYSSERSSHIYLNQWLANIGDGRFFAFLQSMDLSLPGWVIYSLPDGLWMLGFVLILLLIWDFKIDRRSLPWVGMAIAAGLLFEIFQGLKVIRGTFDVIDLIMILVAACIPLLVIMIKQSASFARLIHLINQYDVR